VRLFRSAVPLLGVVKLRSWLLMLSEEVIWFDVALFSAESVVLTDGC
jgi:hypothetical protein